MPGGWRHQGAGRAALWFRKAAEQGSAAALETLGQALMHGNGVRKDPEALAPKLSADPRVEAEQQVMHWKPGPRP